MTRLQNRLLLGAAFGTAVVALVLPSKRDVSVSEYHCVTNQPGKYPVKILATDTGAALHEGGVKRFEIDEKAGTCAYTDTTGETAVYHMAFK